MLASIALRHGPAKFAAACLSIDGLSVRPGSNSPIIAKVMRPADAPANFGMNRSHNMCSPTGVGARPNM